MAKEIDLSVDSEDSRQPVSVENPSTRNLWLTVAIAGCLWFGWQVYQNRQAEPAPNPDDDTVIVDDDKTPAPPKPDPIPALDLTGATLVFVLENAAPTADQSAVMLGVTTEALKAKGMDGFRRYDEEQPQAKGIVEYATAKGVASPLIAIVKDKRPVKVAPFPADPTALEAFLR